MQALGGDAERVIGAATAGARRRMTLDLPWRDAVAHTVVPGRLRTHGAIMGSPAALAEGDWPHSA